MRFTACTLCIALLSMAAAGDEPLPPSEHALELLREARRPDLEQNPDGLGPGERVHLYKRYLMADPETPLKHWVYLEMGDLLNYKSGWNDPETQERATRFWRLGLEAVQEGAVDEQVLLLHNRLTDCASDYRGDERERFLRWREYYDRYREWLNLDDEALESAMPVDLDSPRARTWRNGRPWDKKDVLARVKRDLHGPDALCDFRRLVPLFAAGEGCGSPAPPLARLGWVEEIFEGTPIAEEARQARETLLAKKPGGQVKTAKNTSRNAEEP